MYNIKITIGNLGYLESLESLATLMVQQQRLIFQNPQGYVLILTVQFFVALVEAKMAT